MEDCSYTTKFRLHKSTTHADLLGLSKGNSQTLFVGFP